MSEHVEREALSLSSALETIDRAQAFDAPLRRRTEGLTWMVWGLVVAVIQISFAAADNWFGTEAQWPLWAYPLFLFGWPSIGIVTTYALWRTVGLASAAAAERSRWSILAGALWLPLVYLGWAIVLFLGRGVPSSAMPLLGMGFAWTLLGAFNVFRATSTGRRVLLAVGAAVFLAGVVTSMVPAQQGGWHLAEVLIIAVGGGAPFTAGLWQTLRG